MRILITGISGFVGRRLCLRLARDGHSIVGVDRNPNPRLPEIARYYRGDIARDNILSEVDDDVDFVVHLAADVDICSSSACVTDNVYAVVVLCDWMEERGIDKLIFPSTIGIFQVSEGDAISVAESATPRPQSLYTMTKFLGECCVLARVREVRVIRFPYLFGLGDDKSTLADLIAKVRRGAVPTIRHESRDYLHVDDAVDGVVRAMQYSGLHRHFNLGTGQLQPMEDIVGALNDRFGQAGDPQIKGTRFNARVNWSLANQELGWKPTNTLDDFLASLGPC